MVCHFIRSPERQKLKARDVFWAWIIFAIIAAPVITILDYWWMFIFGGLVNNVPLPYGQWALGWAQTTMLTLATGAWSDAIKHIVYAVVGIITIFGLYFFRMMVPSFFWNPPVMIIGMQFPWGSSACPYSVGGKYIVLKVGEVKLYESVIVPWIVEGLLGQNILFFLFNVYVFFNRSVPRLMVRL